MMAQGEFWVERQNWARWPRVIKINHHTDHGTETRRYLPERHEAAWSEREYAVNKIAELQAENAKLQQEVERLHADEAHWELGNCPSCPNVVSLQEALEQLHELGIGEEN